MARCFLCGKGKTFGISKTHHRGVAGGQWKKKAPKTKRTFSPNLHKFQGKLYCTKCLRAVKGVKSPKSKRTAKKASEKASK
jgi:ribosomal protein L28